MRSTSPVGESAVMRCLAHCAVSTFLSMLTANGDCVPSVSMPSFCLWILADFVVRQCAIIRQVVAPVLSCFSCGALSQCQAILTHLPSVPQTQHNRQQQTTHSLPQEETKKNVEQEKMIDINRVLNKLKNSNKRQAAAGKSRTGKQRQDMGKKKGEN